MRPKTVPKPSQNPEASEGEVASPTQCGRATGPEIGIPRAEWKAAALNRLFQEQAVTGKLGRITAATVERGEKKEKENTRRRVGTR